jgi:hypothetical protein
MNLHPYNIVRHDTTRHDILTLTTFVVNVKNNKLKVNINFKWDAIE